MYDLHHLHGRGRSRCQGWVADGAADDKKLPLFHRCAGIWFVSGMHRAAYNGKHGKLCFQKNQEDWQAIKAACSQSLSSMA